MTPEPRGEVACEEEQVSKYQIDNGGGGKKDLWILAAIGVGMIACLVVVLSQFG